MRRPDQGKIDCPDRAENQEIGEAELEPKHQSFNDRHDSGAE